MENTMPVLFTDEEFVNIKKLMSLYEWAIATVMTKLEIIHDDLVNNHENGAIDYIRSRLKTPESIAQKLHKLGVEMTADSAKQHVKDIAGIRIIAPFATDIYFLVDLIRTIPDIKIIAEKDFIGNPKESGYRSYHLIVEVPIFYSGKTENVAVEIQIRTDAMNFWASLEHKAKYKYHDEIPKHLSDELVVIADKIAELDHRMFLIHEIISLISGDDGIQGSYERR